MINKSLIFFVLYFNYYSSSMAFSYEKLRIPVGGYPQEINIIKSALKLESCDKLSKLNKNWNKVVMEFFILCKALYLGGITPEFEFRRGCS